MTKRGRGRPSRTAEKSLRKRSFRVAASEDAKIIRAAKQNNQTVSEFVRDVVLAEVEENS